MYIAILYSFKRVVGGELIHKLLFQELRTGIDDDCPNLEPQHAGEWIMHVNSRDITQKCVYYCSNLDLQARPLL